MAWRRQRTAVGRRTRDLERLGSSGKRRALDLRPPPAYWCYGAGKTLVMIVILAWVILEYAQQSQLRGLAVDMESSEDVQIVSV